ncbi:radical SAM family heme chaperone HemW [Brachyspira hyodysenteriae]|uniref:radical SAM family heme chaperone HemW n=1 Tax=Brachyspira hyodysenteriae TaxID=159 RepID=UPI00063DA846|nr:radical SAM family heme chaperone HemW [Brachyspira hyodysenteriae]KLI30430.1 coproporphyrinogen III oxidase [Brachyspira hyodysenteriae]MCZ9919147.1 radical SAM family heme chaperone HemW [Brachyspira hyodysenteriae]MCZ9963861.1 radical SAM family heme chaperone HemW [Brachyspira hyodysenteriae]MDA0034529.1 radical SAM family heme chaperone HemW [Brachyspira hyodysenteriae]MDA0048604.1 radical SAM family heme chaperone HemW [Brachyspira hyodysenteriae]
MSGLYIHIPFCTYKCSYCNFYSIVNMNKIEIYKRYIEALILELKLRISDYKSEIETIYLGGGTPSVLGADLLKYLLDNILNIVHIHNKDLNTNFIKEITIESNINDINNEYIKFLENIPNIRLSLGIQTFNEKSVSVINRHIDKKDIIKALKLINKSSLENISLDFICGLPLNSENQIVDDILFSYDLLPKLKHFSLYYLELTESLQKKWKDILPSEEESIIYYKKASDTLEGLGFKRYEVSNYSLPNYNSIHNSNYWLLKDYIGIGVSAVGCYNDNRYSNVKMIRDYFDFIDKNKLPIYENEYLDIDIRKKEFIFLSLRTVKGINIDKYNNYFNEVFYDKYYNIINNNNKYFDISNNYLSIKKSYFDYVDEISILLF